ncbi:GDP-L-fucose synthase [Prochlorococcus marinus str. MIT 1313]|uniref:GDP-L-fucose synthase family protein n=1 Tax=Prochlorococcus TaxID=1218 RepID=UPI0007B3636D|nr:GDP-L-fucose synthase [Prochlorococcus marinus]KZR70237.1 GDP-L-fucose synthase [Prochlorococcus marinus str. MIT 1313]KZR70709.1 GDP-L-fucose synthase [Prochlorococcus marinus str. MIT 1318]
MSLIHPNDRFFVAGAGGMAGGAIVRALKAGGFGDSSHGGALLTPGRKTLDLLDDNAVKDWMASEQPDIVVLAAATVGGIEANRNRPTDFLLQNLRIETQVIEAAWRCGVRRLLFLGSSCIYPKFAAQPIREESLLTGKLEITNEWYAIAKIAGIKLGEALRKQHDFDAISLMPTNLYGPGDNYHPTGSHVLPALIRRFHEAKEAHADCVICWGSGTPLREFLHADDLGEACVFALKHWDPASPNAPRNDKGAPLAFLNVGTGVDLSIKELAEQIAATVGFQGNIQWDKSKPDGTPKKQLDVSRLTSIGWKAKIPLQEGLKLAYIDFLSSLNTGNLRR